MYITKSKIDSGLLIDLRLTLIDLEESAVDSLSPINDVNVILEKLFCLIEKMTINEYIDDAVREYWKSDTENNEKEVVLGSLLYCTLRSYSLFGDDADCVMKRMIHYLPFPVIEYFFLQAYPCLEVNEIVRFVQMVARKKATREAFDLFLSKVKSQYEKQRVLTTCDNVGSAIDYYLGVLHSNCQLGYDFPLLPSNEQGNAEQYELFRHILIDNHLGTFLKQKQGLSLTEAEPIFKYLFIQKPDSGIGFLSGIGFIKFLQSEMNYKLTSNSSDSSKIVYSVLEKLFSVSQRQISAYFAFLKDENHNVSEQYMGCSSIIQYNKTALTKLSELISETTENQQQQEITKNNNHLPTCNKTMHVPAC